MRYYDTINNLNNQKQIYIRAKEELIRIHSDCVQHQELISIYLGRLQAKSLIKAMESHEEYLNKLIESEKKERKSEWENRIKLLESLKEQKKLQVEIYHNKNNQLDQIKDFINNQIANFKENEI